MRSGGAQSSGTSGVGRRLKYGSTMPEAWSAASGRARRAASSVASARASPPPSEAVCASTCAHTASGSARRASSAESGAQTARGMERRTSPAEAAAATARPAPACVASWERIRLRTRFTDAHHVGGERCTVNDERVWAAALGGAHARSTPREPSHLRIDAADDGETHDIGRLKPRRGSGRATQRRRHTRDGRAAKFG